MKRFKVVLAATVLVSGLAIGGYALNNGSAWQMRRKKRCSLELCLMKLKRLR
ncbi:hypothetical protein [Bacillus sp. JCM 19041]|uniref:hypothetical protein n=1 Tax=Bacillus sp. JCM 19041 TaxID=1460637 RepID=UPI0018D15431